MKIYRSWQARISQLCNVYVSKVLLLWLPVSKGTQDTHTIRVMFGLIDVYLRCTHFKWKVPYPHKWQSKRASVIGVQREQIFDSYGSLVLQRNGSQTNVSSLRSESSASCSWKMHEHSFFFRVKRTPVSYTHLDVYKRQGMYIISIM